jgi:lipopolysaccharide/colanic/teichoic acid biosynthesis glycosyltransferase
MTQAVYAVFKRSVDISLSILLLVLFLPVWIIIPILIKLDSPGPVIFRHKRVGRGGQEFDMYKFRSMIDGAHDFLHKQNPQLLKQFKDSDWKLEHDPRITKLGKVLRSLTIDEWPQLLNVLRGEMSLIGPRAYMKQEIAEQTKKYPQTKLLIKEILSIKPGVTGPWQVSGRNEIPFDRRAAFDAEYARQKSLLRDIMIIIKTPKAMLSKW